MKQAPESNEVRQPSRTPAPSSEAARNRMLAAKQRDTKPEKALRSALHKMGLRYRVDYSPLPGMRQRADVVFTKARVAVFVDGCFWHGCPLHGTWPKANAEWWRQKIEANMRRDQETTELLERAGWVVFRIWEHDDPIAMTEAMRRVVTERSVKVIQETLDQGDQ